MKTTILAAGGALGALAASSCCIVPLALVSIGVTGAWTGKLTALSAYQPVILALAVASLSASLWMVYRRRDYVDDDAPCANPRTRQLIGNILWIKAILWIGATLVALSIGIDYGASLFL